MTEVIYAYVIKDVYVINDMYVALTYTICMYVNIGVKGSVRTSGMQPTILDILQNCVYGQKLQYSFPDFSFVFFKNSFVYFASSVLIEGSLVIHEGEL